MNLTAGYVFLQWIMNMSDYFFERVFKKRR